MRADRHADRLYARLAGGAELTSDERRHVATCGDCQRAVADVARLDAQLRTATASLASEPIPDADLEPMDAPTMGWVAPLSAAIAAGVIAIAVGIGISQLRPPTGTDASPTAAPPVTAAPSPSASPVPEPNPRAIGLASGGEPCADGTAGFSIVVPDGWYANLRQGDVMACAYLAQELFATIDPELDPAIQLTMLVDSTPRGTVVEHLVGDSGADEWLVERDGEEWWVTVYPLLATIGDEPSYLHLAFRAADEAAGEAIRAIRERLTISEPLLSGGDGVAAAEALFADADVCSDLERGVNVVYPDPWWTNTVLGDLETCSYFAPESFDIVDEGLVPDGVAITLEVVAGNEATIEEILGFETLFVNEHAATRWELTPGLGDPPPDTRTYQYHVELDDTPEDGPNLVLTISSERSDDYERDKAVLDKMMLWIIISPTPALILDLEPLPFCRSELVERTVEGDRHDAAARDCFWADYEADRPSQMISTHPTVEGMARAIYRVVGPDEIEWIIDASPGLGSSWYLFRCTALERSGSDELSGAILFEPSGCGDPVEVQPEAP